MAIHRKTLAVQGPGGQMITAEVERFGNDITLRTEPIFETIADGTNNTPDGRIIFTVAAVVYPEAVRKLEAYLETLMLGRIDREDRNSGVVIIADDSGPTETSDPGIDGPNQGEDNSSVDSRGDGDEPSKRPKRRRKSTASLGETGDSGPGPGGEDGNEAIPEPREGDE